MTSIDLSLKPNGLLKSEILCFLFLKLESIARGTLGVGKFADGLQAVQWWKEGKIEKIIEYCIQDVKVTRDVFEYGKQNGKIKILRADDQVKEVPVQWN